MSTRDGDRSRGPEPVRILWAFGILAASVAMLLWPPAPLPGQEPTPGPGETRLTLDQALRLAEQHNPAYRRTTISLELNAIEGQEAWLRLLPRPQLSVLNTTMSWNLQRVGTDPFGNPLPNPEARTVQSSQSRQQAGMSFSFNVGEYMGFRGRHHNATTRRVGASQHLHEIRGEVTRVFLEAQQQQVTVELETELLARQHENRALAERLFALAQRQEIDLLEADLEIAVQEEELRQSQARLSTVLLRLRNLIGDPELGLSGVEPAPFRDLDPRGLDDDALVEAALASSPAIALQEAVIQQAERQLTEQRWQQWMPTFSFGMSMSRTELDRGGGGAFFQPLPDAGWERNITLQISLPDLARRLENRTATHREQIELRNADETMRERRLQVEQDVRTTLVDLRTAFHSVALQEQRVALAERRLDERLQAYRLGRGTFQDLQNATDALAAAQRALLGGRHQFEGALIALEQALGAPFESVGSWERGGTR